MFARDPSRETVGAGARTTLDGALAPATPPVADGTVAAGAGALVGGRLEAPPVARTAGKAGAAAATPLERAARELADLLAVAATESGYAARVEHLGGAAAEVLTKRGRAMVAFEVRLGFDAEERTRERQAELEEAGWRAAWFFRSPPTEPFASSPVPVITVRAEPDHHSPLASLGEVTLPAYDLAAALLEGDVKFRARTALVGHFVVGLYPAPVRCYRCGLGYVAALGSACRLDAHGRLHTDFSDDAEYPRAEHLDPTGALIRRALERASWNERPKTDYRLVARARTSAWAYANTCPHCRAVLASHVLAELYAELRAGRAEGLDEVRYYRVRAGQATVSSPHWCFKKFANTRVHCPESSEPESGAPRAELGYPAPYTPTEEEADELAARALAPVNL